MLIKDILGSDSFSFRIVRILRLVINIMIVSLGCIEQSNMYAKISDCERYIIGGFMAVSPKNAMPSYWQHWCTFCLCSVQNNVLLGIIFIVSVFVILTTDVGIACLTREQLV